MLWTRLASPILMGRGRGRSCARPGHPGFLLEDVLDPGAHLRLSRVGPGGARRHRPLLGGRQPGLSGRAERDGGIQLSSAQRHLVDVLWSEWCATDRAVETLTREIEAIAARGETCRRLLTVPGVDPLVARRL
jgi:transposase